VSAPSAKADTSPKDWGNHSMKFQRHTSCIVIWSMCALWFAAPARAADAISCGRNLDEIKNSASAILPWEADFPGIWWEARAKYYVIAAVDSIRGSADADLRFARNDAALLAQRLCQVGFEAAGGADAAVLTGPNATADNVIRAAKAVQQVPGEREPLLVVYYSGHGLRDAPGNRLSLQFWDQDDISVGDGTSLDSLLSRIRAVLPRFQLLVVIDACFSGAALALSGVDPSLLENVTLLMSSAKDEFSRPLLRDDGTEVSAFTGFVLNLLEKDDEWWKADTDRDGLLWAEDVFHFADDAFAELSTRNPGAFQSPMYSAFGRPQLFAYDRRHLENAHSPRRGSFIRVQLQVARGVDGTITINKERVQPVDLQVTVSAGGKPLGTTALSTEQSTALALGGVLQLPVPGAPTGQLTYSLSTRGKVLAIGSFDLKKTDAVLLIDDEDKSLLTSHVGKKQGGALSGALVLEKVSQ
jgi:hypothetical protein